MKENYNSSEKMAVRAQLFYRVSEETPGVQQSRSPEPTRTEGGGKSCCGQRSEEHKDRLMCPSGCPQSAGHGGTTGSRARTSPHHHHRGLRNPGAMGGGSKFR